ncbi:MAG TPA: di-heme oxidoredictase family protein, partial [Pirellulaceae bacterium]|nr:di-heme oxidoredictase family protein [Pirellulaceae bacterium]
LVMAAPAIVLLIPSRAAIGGDAASPLEEGKALFERRFAAGDAPALTGDGLGPVFNNVSCAACHLQAGVGGGGPIDVNAVILTAQLAGTRPKRDKLVEALRELHPGFLTTDGKIVPSVLLHRFGTDLNYAGFLRGLGAPYVPEVPDRAQQDELVYQLAQQPLPTATTAPPIRLTLSHRNTTALFGAGLIDQVPDSVLHAQAAAQTKQGEVSGRVPPVGIDFVGRFGWRGQTERLHDFVLGACANELGLEVPGIPQPRNPLQPDYRPAGLDLTAAQCASLTSFVASLPPPKLLPPDEPAKRAVFDRGQVLFHSVGCASCHVEKIGPLDHVYSDLLLHDMGPALADPLLAAPALRVIKQTPLEQSDAELLLGSTQPVSSQPKLPQPQLPPPRGYYGESSSSSFALLGEEGPATITVVDRKAGVKEELRAVVSPLDREWRTPPLWGLADSAPYLHDGRAATVVEAIAFHAGEADACTKRYFALPAGDRMAVLQFLACLQAPK